MIRITTSQRLVLADCTRLGLVGWLVTDPVVGHKARRFEHMATTIGGFRFSRFATLAMNELGPDYMPKSPASAMTFPLSIAEAAALANDIELELATPEQLHAAALIAAFSPYGQPEVGTRDWRSYVSVLNVLGVFVDEGYPNWRAEVESALRPFCRAVASSYASTISAE
ncbi:hypothetical protein JL101_036470 (plasmid) [Skermanella rosea]|uniref:hypothetical protein n=1 Tax=Skermanella rosea TaxID=1817965 RepID=UPI0019325F25|nr:hypothetical protein [Skermanella rosea]UEM08239.1 hypothetical protein JL101_036470 [Skermanella rosea]